MSEIQKPLRKQLLKNKRNTKNPRKTFTRRIYTTEEKLRKTTIESENEIKTNTLKKRIKIFKIQTKTKIDSRRTKEYV